MIKLILQVVGVVVLLVVVVTGVRLLLLKRSVISYKNYWQKQASLPSSDDGFVYIALGDSAAQGVGASSATNGYVGLMTKYYIAKTQRPVHVINISVSGAKLRDVIDEQVPQLKNLPKASFITIEAGANDIASFDEAKFTREFAELANSLPTGTLVANMPSFKNGRANSLDKTVQQANAIIATELAKHEGLYPVDLYATTKNQKIWNYAADLFHPNSSGYINWANAFVTTQLDKDKSIQ